MTLPEHKPAARATIIKREVPEHFSEEFKDMVSAANGNATVRPDAFVNRMPASKSAADTTAKPGAMKPFSLDQFERYDLHAQLIDYAAKLAVDEGIIDRNLLNRFGVTPNNGIHHHVEKLEKDDILAERQEIAKQMAAGTYNAEEQEEPRNLADNLLHLAQQFRAVPEADKPKAFARLQEQAKLTPKEQTQIANLLDLLVPVINAANSVKEKEFANNNPDDTFKNYLLSGLKVVRDGKNIFNQRPQEWLEGVKASKEKLILSFINTSHPTNFHTPVGRRYEKSLITLFNTMHFEKDGILKMDDLEGAFATQITNACHAIKAKNAVEESKGITYTKKVTVGEEMDTEKDVLSVQKKAMADVLQSWNMALSDTDVVKAAVKVSPGLKSKLAGLYLSEKEKEKTYEQRSWILGGADKDGRDESTDTVFYAGYRGALDSKGRYSGPIMDLRENAEVRKKLLSALISRAYSKNDDFRKLCAEFHASTPDGGEAFDPNGLGFGKMSEDKQQKFLEYLMTNDIGLYNQRITKTETIGFNKAFYDLLHGNPAIPGDPGFLKQHGLDKHDTFPMMKPKLRQLLDKEVAKMRGVVEKGRNPTGPVVENAHYKITEVKDDNRDVTGFMYTHGELKPLVENQPNLDNSRKLNEEEVLSCMSYLRRLYLVRHVIKEQQALGTPNLVVEREQAANFENASDFFAQLYLYQQAGLVKIENGKVTEATIGIQPLFETTPEMLRGPEIIDKILASPLAESYYRTRGKAEFMVGYSDGAKSGGNFASHVRIREFERVVTEKFKAKFGEDYEVRIMRGPGRGENRGGVRKYDRQYTLHDDSVNTSAVNDQTLQGDLIIRMQMDPHFTRRTFADIMVSTIAGAVKGLRAQTVKAKAEKGDEISKFEVRRNESFEKAINFIADFSEDEYRKGIFEKEDECDAFLKTVIRNPEASSRRQKRADTKQKGIGPQRAITVEYAANIAGVPLHDYGFRHAMEAFVASGRAVLDKDGHEVTGEKALEVLARDSEFFREELKLCTIRQQTLNPTIADIWAKKAGQEPFIDDIIKNVTGLGDKCEQLLTGNKLAKAHPREDASGEPFLQGFSDVAQAIVAASGKLEKTIEQRLYFAMAAAVSERPIGNMRVQTPGFGLAI